MSPSTEAAGSKGENVMLTWKTSIDAVAATCENTYATEKTSSAAVVEYGY